jgi:LysM repeat protein
MALINNLYVCVTEEQMKKGVTVSEHPVEKGLPITDNVKRNAIELSLTGYIVNVNKTKAKSIIDKLDSYSKNGKYVKYVGRCILSNALITEFNYKYSNKVDGGCEFDMTIKEVRIAKSAYVKSKSKKKTTSTKQVTKKKKSTKRYYTVKTGDCLWTIAQKYYGNGMQYTKIYNANKAMIDKRNKGYNVDKYTIYTGQRFLIP